MKWIIAIVVLFLPGCKQSSQTKEDLASEEGFKPAPVLKGPYLGQPAPGMTPEIFAEGFISKETKELNSVFSSDGKKFYFSREVNGVYQILFTEQVDNVWTSPKMVSFSRKNPTLEALDGVLSPDQKSLYFISNRPAPPFKEKSVNIWKSRWNGTEWLTPEVLPSPVNTDFNECYPMFVSDGSMYFGSSRNGSYGKRDVYYMKSKNGILTNPVNLGPNINSEYNENDPYVAPDESYLIVPSFKRPDGHGKSDLYISFKNEEGQWSKAINMGEPINSEQSDFCPVVSPDGKYLFFTRGEDIYWVDARIIDQFKSK